MGKLIDLTGQRFGMLTVLSRDGTYKSENDPYSSIPTWRCRCDCGQETIVMGNNLKYGATRSCGCLRAEKSRERMQARHDIRFRIANGI